ncbi:hypothetical protein RSOLAG1IB_04914 [Rhizoctonia solani AG-1 IB]|uniref:Uncharacterized protein n=1 Tax=Thanatephorus cucumeris (strain AG1-IB / isolate 7/3/14) TaxID=1108050 RepID=A0A0B7G262_THACB|nr:hypothetical protein RSOLAG1IB_04914 [Rhizoctonia solani AG-1 IB]
MTSGAWPGPTWESGSVVLADDLAKTGCGLNIAPTTICLAVCLCVEGIVLNDNKNTNSNIRRNYTSSKRDIGTNEQYQGNL